MLCVGDIFSVDLVGQCVYHTVSIPRDFLHHTSSIYSYSVALSCSHCKTNMQRCLKKKNGDSFYCSFTEKTAQLNFIIGRDE